MRYVNTKDENRIWLILASLWAGGGLIAWCSALLLLGDLVAGGSTTSTGYLAEPISGGELTLLALAIVGIGLSLRLPILTALPHEEQLSDHIVLLLGYLATVNWLGFLILRSTGLVEVLPALLIATAAEVWIHHRFFSERCLPWLDACLALFGGRGEPKKQREKQRVKQAADDYAADRPTSELSTVEGQATADGADTLGSDALEANLLGSDGFGHHDHEAAEGFDDAMSEGEVRTAVEGLDDEGRRYMSGGVRIEMASEQNTEEVVVAFCPAFIGSPEVDFEADDEHFQVRLVNVSPSGMRIAVRRRGNSEELKESQRCQLQWFAVQFEAVPSEVSGKPLP